MALQLEIVSPEKLLLSKAVEMVTIPAAEGEMGVLENHAPMLVMLRGGTITLTENGHTTDRLYVAGGFAEVTPERCTVLAVEAIPVAELSAAVAEKRLAEANAAFDGVDKMDVTAIDTAMDRIQSARAMVEAAGA
jgi:F-type H+-transporting ATPase subunit epsilon